MNRIISSGLLVLMVLIMIIACDNDASKTADSQEDQYLQYPQTQKNFIETINFYEDEYSKANNELKKSAVRTKRGEQLKTVLRNKRTFDNWVATVKEMNTTSNGKAYFSVMIEGTKIGIANMNNEFSDMFDNTLIDQNRSLYQIISELKIGDKIIASGEFLKSDKTDFVYESSLTEEGSMESPDFIVKFKRISK
jgi:hypothetical protein